MEKTVKRPSVDWRKAIRDFEDVRLDECFYTFVSKKLKDKLKKKKKPLSYNRICYYFCLSFFGKAACERYRWLGHF